MALRNYLESRDPGASAAAWREALSLAREKVSAALRDSNLLFEIPAALEKAGEHMCVFRAILAPPMSQDQFSLLCPAWKKSSEKQGRRLTPAVAQKVGLILEAWRDKSLTGWLQRQRRPTRPELRRVLTAVAPILARQTVETLIRNQLASKQEGEVIRRLAASGWVRVPSTPVARHAALPSRHFMHKTRFATTTRPQEVDIACGLSDTVVLAMECKVTNDQTNSVKRVNDVLKKAAAWQRHWGSFVKTAALLQGVISHRDVMRLVSSDVHVFWSHDLSRFERWLGEHVPASAMTGATEKTARPE